MIGKHSENVFIFILRNQLKLSLVFYYYQDEDKVTYIKMFFKRVSPALTKSSLYPCTSRCHT